MKAAEFYETVPLMELVWWDRESDTPCNGSPTGANINVHDLTFEKRPRYEQRLITRAYGKRVHIGCGGTVVFTSGKCPKGQLDALCLDCGATACIEY